MAMESASVAAPQRSKRRRVMSGGLLLPGSRRDGKKALYNCKYCGMDLSDTLRIRSVGPDPAQEPAGALSSGKEPKNQKQVESSATPTNLCLECFSVGAEPWPHKRTHAYRVVEVSINRRPHRSLVPAPPAERLKRSRSVPIPGFEVLTPSALRIIHRDLKDLSVPLFHPNWGCDEELLLLEALEIYGPGNWTEIAEHVGRKDKFECRDHYFEQYINSPNAPLPVVPTPRELEQRKRELEREAEGATRERKGAVLEGEPPKVEEEEAGTEAGDGGAEGAPGAAAADQDQDPNAQLLRGLSDDIRARAEGNQVEITGYNVKRDDFEPEHDNDAEVALAELEIRADDPEEERREKLEMLRVYHYRQRERYSRRAFVTDRGLLNVRQQQQREKKATKEEKEIAALLRVFARFQGREEHEALVKGIQEEQRLRKRIGELKEYRRMGVLTLAEAGLYEQDKRRRESDRERQKQTESYLQQPSYKSGKAQRAMRYASRAEQGGGEGGEAAVMSGPGSSRELQGLRIEEPGKDGREKVPSNLTLSGKEMEPACLDGAPYLDLLSAGERSLCEQLRLLPSQYLSIRSGMAALARGRGKEGPDRDDVRDAFKVDVYKLNKIQDFLFGQ